jgi:menaquinone-specific isochorismate synthase
MTLTVRPIPTADWSDDAHVITSPDEAAIAQARLNQRLLSVSMPAPEVDALSVLRATTHDQRFYWAGPVEDHDRGDEFAGSGVAAELLTAPLLDGLAVCGINRFASIRQQVDGLFADSAHQIADGLTNRTLAPASSDHPARPRLFGGFAFSPEFVPDNTWSVFHPAHFILPHFQFALVDRQPWLTINALSAVDEGPEDAATSLLEALTAGYDILRSGTVQPAVGRSAHVPVKASPTVRYPMTQEQWITMVTGATQAVADGALAKVVLARAAEVRRQQPLNPLVILERLGVDYANSYRFLFEPLRDHFFLGATPELLISLRDDGFQSMALAGSIGRGDTPAEDSALASQLLTSAKDRHEHALVRDAVRARLEPISAEVALPADPTVLTLPNIQHLLTPIDGRLADRAQTDVLSLVELLHPTPALGGVPVDRALSFLTVTEPVPRGWYAAPVGWLDQQLDGAFAVAIRSAVCQYERAWLYAGAGIVRDSDPQREWDETELKFKTMLNVITEGDERDERA